MKIKAACDNRNRSSMKCRRHCCKRPVEKLVTTKVQTTLVQRGSYSQQKLYFWNTL